MFVDASVIVAILNEESGFEELEKQLEASGKFHVSPLVRFEAVAALVRIRLEATNWKTDRAEIVAEARGLVDGFIQALDAKDIAIDTRIGLRALDAMASYVKLAGHPAALNFGDCFAYAAAQTYRLKLAYKGNDFAQTDLA
jgi:ribonuclease VapC